MPRRGWLIAALVLMLGSLTSVAPGSIPEDRNVHRWTSRYNAANADDFALSLVSSPDGSTVYVTGYSVGAGSFEDFATVAYDVSTGTSRWSARYNGPGNGSDVARSVAVSPDGSSVFVTGYGPGLGTGVDYTTIAYDASNGAELWVARYNGPMSQPDYATTIAVSPDGSRVFVAGLSLGSGSNPEDMATIAYDALTGAQLWAARFNDARNVNDDAWSITVSPDGSSVFIAGQTGSSFESDFTTVAYASAEGTQLWAVHYQQGSYWEEAAFSVLVSLDGRSVFVTGYGSLWRDNYDYVTVAYAASTGKELWVARYNGPGDRRDIGRASVLSPDGGSLFVTGSSTGSGTSYDITTVAYSTASGERLWDTRYNGPANSDDLGASIAIDPAGKAVFVTGQSIGSGSAYDIITIAYGALSGKELWTARYNGPANSHDLGRSVTVTPDGANVLVTGYTSDSSFDYATLAYRATSCENGQQEDGPLFNATHFHVEPNAGPAAPFLHGVNCEVAATTAF